MTTMANDTTTTPARITRVGGLRAAHDGGAAARAGKPVTACPYGGNSLVDRFMRHYWVKGYTAASTAD